MHLSGLRSLGVVIHEEGGVIHCDGGNMHSGEVHLDYPSVGATENILMAAVLLPDRAYNWLMRYEQFGMVLLVVIISVGIGSNALDAAIRGVITLFCRIVGF